jgi:hypothetical protein
MRPASLLGFNVERAPSLFSNASCMMRMHTVAMGIPRQPLTPHELKHGGVDGHAKGYSRKFLPKAVDDVNEMRV